MNNAKIVEIIFKNQMYNKSYNKMFLLIKIILMAVELKGLYFLT